MRKFRWIAVPLAALALVAAGCGGDEDAGDEDTSDATATETTTTEVTATTDAPTEATATTEATGTAAGETGDGDSVNLDEIFGGFGQASFNVTYEIDGDAEGQGLSGEWTWIQDVDGDRTRFEGSAEGETVVMITTPEQTIMCAQGTCFDAGAMGAAVPDVGDMFTEGVDEVQPDASTATARQVDGREVAGTDTECVEFEDSAENATGLACYTEEGIPLLVESTAPDGTFRMEATSYSSEVSDADFEPPFPVTSLGG